MTKLYSYAYTLLILSILSGFVSHSFAQQEDTIILYKPNIDELSGLERVDKSEAKISVAGFSSTTLRESPGIVSLITAEEIANMGAKDLLDVLRLVPGFDVSIDILPILSIRGNGTNEAKVLVLVDGHTINDISLGYAFLMQRFPLSNIERIEIIRGAGSAIYGGVAGLAVINIITKKVQNNQEVSVLVTGGATANTWYRNNLEAYTLTKFNNGLTMNLSASHLGGKITDVNYIGGLNRDFVDNLKRCDISSEIINLNLQYKKLDFAYLHNNYINRLAYFGDAKIQTRGSFFRLGYRIDASEKLVIHTRLMWKEQVPFTMFDAPLYNGFRIPIIESAKTNDRRISLNTYAVYQLLDNLMFTAGAEIFQDRSRYRLDTAFADGKSVVEFYNLGFFSELDYRSRIANITAGLRYDKYSKVEGVVVPRLAITKALERLHFKALYTEAFKTPTVQNIQLARGGSILPERYRLIEFETGIRLGKGFQASVNVYDIQIRQFITREDNLVNGVPSAQYINIGNLGTQGIEAEGRWKQPWGYIHLGYSFYRVSQNQPQQKLARVSQVFAGIPAQKATLNAQVRLNPKLSLNATAMYLTNKFKTNIPPDDITDSAEFPEELHLQLYTAYRDFLIPNLTLGIGGSNLLNQTLHILPWKRDFSSDVFLPAQSREFYFRLLYNLRP